MTRSNLKSSLEFIKYKWYSLILAKVLHICNVVYYVLYHEPSPCNLPSSFEFSENRWAVSGYRAFRLCTIIVIFTACIHFYYFKGAMCVKFRNLNKKITSFPKRSRIKPMIFLLLALLQNIYLLEGAHLVAVRGFINQEVPECINKWSSSE